MTWWTWAVLIGLAWIVVGALVGVMAGKLLRRTDARQNRVADRYQAAPESDAGDLPAAS